MPSTPARHLYEYAIVRFIPSVERGEHINVGLVMMCKRSRWLKCRFNIDSNRIKALFPQADIDCLNDQLKAFADVADGAASPIGSLETHERFRWLSAVRSASISTSRPHPGQADDLDATFESLFSQLVLL